MHDLRPDSLLSRFLLRRHRQHINHERQSVKSSLFSSKPPPSGFSVFHTSSLSETEIWHIAENYVVTDPEQQPLLGRCDLEIQYYEHAELEIEKSEPPPKHYNIHGMPVGSDMEEAKKLALRQMLVANSKLILIEQ